MEFFNGKQKSLSKIHVTLNIEKKININNKKYEQKVIHGFAGTMILTSLLLGIFVHQNWFWLTGFVGANLFQTLLPTGVY